MKKLFKTILIITILLPLAGFSAKPSNYLCRIDGCSGQLCVSALSAPMGSTCEWKESYSCYQKLGSCEKQPDGKCGWTKTPALEACLVKAEKTENNSQ